MATETSSARSRRAARELAGQPIGRPPRRVSGGACACAWEWPRGCADWPRLRLLGAACGSGAAVGTARRVGGGRGAGAAGQPAGQTPRRPPDAGAWPAHWPARCRGWRRHGRARRPASDRTGDAPGAHLGCRRPRLGAAGSPRVGQTGRPAAGDHVAHRHEPEELHDRDLGDLEEHQRAREHAQVAHELREQPDPHRLDADEHEGDGHQQRGQLTDELEHQQPRAGGQVLGLVIGLLAGGRKLVDLGRHDDPVDDARRWHPARPPPALCT